MITKEEIDKKRKLADAKLNEYNKLNDEINELEIEYIIDRYEEQYIRYQNYQSDDPQLLYFMKVDCVWGDIAHDDIIFEGYAFNFNCGEYRDDTRADWTMWTQEKFVFHKFSDDGVYSPHGKDDNIGLIKVISKEEFDAGFDEMIQLMKERHNRT